MRAYLFLMLLAAGTTYLTVPLVRALALRVGAMTPVRARDVHATPTPRLGGVAMFVGVAVAFVVASQMRFLEGIFSSSSGPWGVLAAAGVVCALGVADDIWDLDALTKLAGQVLAAGLMAWQGVQLATLPVGGITVGSPRLFLLLTVLVVVVAINAVNFIDGLDGLAAGAVGIGGAAFFAYTYLLSRNTSPGDYSNLASLTVVVLVGVCAGFLPHNVNPARIFMGDSGAMLLGLMLAASAVAVTTEADPSVISTVERVPIFVPVLLPFAVMVLPLLDLVWAVARRTLRGESPFSADRGHLHHRMLDLGHTHRQAVWVLWAWSAVVAFGMVSLALVRPVAVAASVWAVLAVLVAVATVGPRARRGGRAGGRGAGGAGASGRPRRRERARGRRRRTDGGDEAAAGATRGVEPPVVAITPAPARAVPAPEDTARARRGVPRAG